VPVIKHLDGNCHVYVDDAAAAAKALATEARAMQARPALLHAAKIDRMIKGLASGDIWDGFLQLALRLTRTRTAS
jgi:DNA polymerase-3 subunit delta